MELSSPAFHLNGRIPKKYTCDGENVSPPLLIDSMPAGTESLVLIVDDPDAPNGLWVHWVVWNISPQERIEEGHIPGTQGLNDFGKYDYGGPCPPSGTHRYFFKLYAVDSRIDIDHNSTKEDIEKAIEGHVLAKAELVGLYSRE